MNREEFGKKFLEVLGDSQEAAELTDVDLEGFFKEFTESGLSLEDWLKEYDFKPCPSCPKCGKQLKMVFFETHGERYEWTGHAYESEDSQTQTFFFCGECNRKIGSYRADGESWGFIPEVE